MTEEGLLKTKIRKYLTQKNVYWASIQGGPGSKPGDPDMVVCKDGRFIALEMKAKSGRQSPIQMKREQEIKESGGEYYLIRRLEEVKEIIEGENVVESE